MSRSAGRIGWVLVWAVVFCDIGTSVYYVPGLLYETTQDRAGFFVVSTLVAFVLLAAKYVDVTRRFPAGGGGVSVADEALGPWWGCLGGQLIMVDYFLTVAISAIAGMYYVDSVFHLGDNVLPATLVALGVLGALNIVGVKESALASLALALVAAVVDVGVIGATVINAPPRHVAALSPGGSQPPGAHAVADVGGVFRSVAGFFRVGVHLAALSGDARPERNA